MVFSFAHSHYIISNRKNSTWNKRIKRIQSLNSSYLVDYPVKHNESWQPILSERRFDHVKLDHQVKYLIHWTRGTNGPWRGESKAGYFEDLTTNYLGNPRNGYHILRQIISSKLLRGSGKLIKGGEPVISFTDTNFGSVFSLIRYRNSLGHWNFEPYGLGFPMNLLKSIGARSVSYGEKREFDALTETEKLYFQYNIEKEKFASRSTNWSNEGEWRLLGDLDFESIIQKAIFIVPTKTEADNL